MPHKTGAPGWEDARAAVAASMEAVGTVVVTHDALGADLREALFGRAMPEFFALPRDLKRRLVSGAVNGYIGRRPGAPAYERARVWEAAHGGGVRNLGDILWSHGNPAFCDTVARFAKNMQDLQRKLGTMILESLGVQRSTSSRTSKHSPTTSGWCTTARCRRRGRRPACPCNPTGSARGWSYTYSSMSADIDDFVQNYSARVHHGRAARRRRPRGAGRGRELGRGSPGARHGHRRRRRAAHGGDKREGAGRRPPRQDAERPGAAIGAVRVHAQGRRHGAPAVVYNHCSFSDYVDFRFAGDGRKLSDPLQAFCGAPKDKQ
ncbi:hypothetical protein GQ55_6G186300 [Panicum hallii var. hallii]|uniref:Uncharacterized protein n=1 Tax=Panicum hallii var. hallii TaxID=1504633 RepID=A0A2T7D790_9POAL|nr:hypothetical protein GQ55_6G186300 [Panicum hallii var. hallii]